MNTLYNTYVYFQRPDIARLMQMQAQAQANLASAGGGGSLPHGISPAALGLPNLPTSLPSSLLASLPSSLAASLGAGLPGGHLHPALSMLKPQLPGLSGGSDNKREDDIRKSLSESNGEYSSS
jgi:hypothetical protein